MQLSASSKISCIPPLFFLIGQREHSCSHLQQVRAHLKGTVSWKLRHRLLYIIRKLSLQGSDGTQQNFKNIKPLPRNLRIKYTAFTRYFTFKGPASAQVFGIPCVQNTWNPFAWVKSRARQPKTNTFKVKCPHLNFAQIFACKTPFESTEHPLKYDHVTFFVNIPLWKCFAWPNLRTVKMRTFNCQSVLHTDAKPWADAGPLNVKYPLNAENFTVYFIAWRFSILKNVMLAVQCLKRKLSNDVEQPMP